MEPGIEPVRVTKTGQVAPGADERFLDRVARELRVPEDEAGRRVQPRKGRVDKLREGVMIAPLRASDELSLVHGRLDCVTTMAVVSDRVWRRSPGKGSPRYDRPIMTTDDTAPHEHEHHHQADGDDGHQHRHEPLEYSAAVEAFRADKDHYFRHGDRSPVPPLERETFQGLAYFPVDEGLRFDGRLLEAYDGSEPQRFQIPTSDGRLLPAHRAGSLRFELAGERRSLAAYVLDHPSGHVHAAEAPGGPEADGSEAPEEELPGLFVPFLDATSGKETYGAGRYLDLEPEDDSTYILDFNLAYHPSCVYDVRFSCPLTPAENRLPIRIEAGERLPAGYADGH
jgi:uncharacterized protein